MTVRISLEMPPVLVACYCCLAAAAFVSVRAQRLELYEGDACKRVAGVQWTCKKIKDCMKAQESLTNGNRPETCGFADNEIIVCCEPTPTILPPTPRRPDVPNPPPPTPTTPNKPSPTPPTRIRPEVTNPTPPTQTRPNKPRPPHQSRGAKSKQMCKKYAESVFLNVTSETGEVTQSFDFCVRVEPLITNGTKARPREFPHMALIGYGDKDNIQWNCGGSLISERWVLSAAHCTRTGNNRAKWVRLGEYNVHSRKDEDEKEAKSEDFDIIERINHPQHDKKKQYNDIALYKLNRDVVFNEYVRPICLQTEYRLPTKVGLITGWGRIGYRQISSDILQQGNVTFISGKQCRDSLETIGNLDREIRDNTMICAANFLTNTDTCQGDSGGPLQYRLNEPYCMFSQVGITSFGVRCAYDFPAVYTRVSAFITWIENIVWPLSSF